MVWAPDAEVVVSGSSGGLIKQAGSNTAWDCDAVSSGVHRLVGDGSVSFQVAANSGLAVGLSLINGGEGYQDIDYGIVVRDDNTAVVVHGATVGASLGSYSPNTIFKITRVGSQITFIKEDGILGSVSINSNTPSFGLVMADSSFLRLNATAGSQLIQAYMDNGDSDADGMPDSWELTQFPPYESQNINAFTPGGDADADGVSNIKEFEDGSNPWDALSKFQTVVWQNHVGTQNLGGSEGGLAKTGATAGWNADAESSQTIIGDGKISFQITSGSYVAVGLTVSNDDRKNTDLDYGVQVTSSSNTALAIRPEGANISIGEFTSETQFAIQRVGGQVQYLKDGVVVYTSSQLSAGTLRVDCSLYGVSTQLARARIYTGDVDNDGLPDDWELQYLPLGADYNALASFGPLDDPDGDSLNNLFEYQNGLNPIHSLEDTNSPAEYSTIHWIPSSTTNVSVNTSTGSIQKIDGSNNWTSADGLSQRKMYESGRVNFRVNAGSYLAVGLTSSNDSMSYTDHEYSIRFISDGNVDVYENGSLAKDLGKYDSNTRFAIRRVGGKVEYLKDGIVHYSSSLTADGVYEIDCALRNEGSMVLESNFYDGDLDNDLMADKWEIIQLTRILPLNTPIGFQEINTQFNPNDDPDGDGVTNLNEFLDGTDPLQGLSAHNTITWTSLHNTSLWGASGGLKKTSGVAGYNADAISAEAFPVSTVAYFSVPPTGSLAVGLTYQNNSRAATDLEYAFLLTASTAKVQRPETSTDLDIGEYSEYTRFGIRHTAAGEIEFLKDGVVVYTSTTPTTGALYADCSISSQNHFIKSAVYLNLDQDGDGIDDLWELSYLPPDATLTDLTNLSPLSDTDEDGLSLLQEWQYGTSPTNADTDNDGMPDGWEVTYGLAVLDPSNALKDKDGDGVTNLDEYLRGTNPNVVDIDTDGDEMPDSWEILMGFDPNNPDEDGDLIPDGNNDFDADGLLNVREYLAGTDPLDVDTDDDGLADGWEVFYGFDPRDADEDNNGIIDSLDDRDTDGLTNAEEVQYGTDPTKNDTDDDGLFDKWELLVGLDPNIHDEDGDLIGDSESDFDHDGLNNLEEYLLGTHPTNADTDGDGLPDGWEILNGSDPLDDDENDDNISDGLIDNDADGLSNAEEIQAGTDHTDPDTDDDGLPDGWEVQYALNPLNADQDGNSQTDDLDDFDADGLTNAQEVSAGTNPTKLDTDGDQLPDGWEVTYLLNPTDSDQDDDGVSDHLNDFDGDGLNNLREFTLSSHPLIPETDQDGDGLFDAWEVFYSFDAALADQDENEITDGEDDFDGDGLTNLQEMMAGTHPLQLDSDGDGLPDGWEVYYTLNPLDGDQDLNQAIDSQDDFDDDSLSNLQEYQLGTHPLLKDTDGDGLPDDWEINHGLNPLDSSGVNGADGDSDGDGYTNLQEWGANSDPSDAASVPAPVQDQDQDGVPDDEDLVPYDPDIQSSRSLGAGARRYAVIDIGAGWGSYNSMGADGKIVWGSEGGGWKAWSPETGTTVSFSNSDIATATGLTLISVQDIGPDGRLHGQGMEVAPSSYDRLFSYDPFSGVGVAHPRFSGHTGHNFDSYGYIRGGANGSLLAGVDYADSANRMRRSLVMVNNGLQTVLEDMLVLDDAPDTEPPNDLPETIIAGTATERDFTYFCGAGGVVIGSIHKVSDVVDYHYSEPISGELFVSRDYIITQSRVDYRLLTSLGQTISLGERDIITQNPWSFGLVPSYAPIPWLIGNGLGAGSGIHDHLWLPTDVGYVQKRIYASAQQYDLEQPLDYLQSVNGRGEVMAYGYMSDGSYDWGIWANGEAASLTEMVGQEVIEAYEEGWIFLGLSDQGTLAMSATRISDNSRRMLLLMPVEVDYISRDPVTGTFSRLGGLIAESSPAPDVDLAISDAQLTASGELSFTITVTVRDTLAELTNSHIQSLQVYMDGLLADTVALGSGSGDTNPLWTPHAGSHSVIRSYTIPNPAPSGHAIRVQTSPNAIGNIGWDAATFVLKKNRVGLRELGQPSSTIPSLPTVEVAFTAAPTSDSVDTVVTKINSAIVTLDEPSSAPACKLFSGQINASSPVSLQIVSSTNFSDTVIDQFDALLEWRDSNGRDHRIHGLWRETSANTLIFEPYTIQYIDDSRVGNMSIVGVINGSGSPPARMEPFVARFTIPQSLADKMADGQILKTRLSGEIVQLVKNNSLIPDDLPSPGMSHLYIAEDDMPKVFAAIEEFATELCPGGDFTEGLLTVDMIQDGASGNSTYDASASFIKLPQPPTPAEQSTNNEGSLEAYSLDEVLIWYEILFGEYGMQVLQVYQDLGESTLKIQLSDLNDLTNWHDYEIDNWFDADAANGLPCLVLIDNDQKSAVQAAMSLYYALHELKGPFTRNDVRLAQLEAALDRAISADAAGEETWRKLANYQFEAIGEALQTCYDAAAMGISIANEGASWVLTLTDAEEEWQQGSRWTAAGMVALELVPFISGRLAKTGRSLLIKRVINGQEFELTAEVAGALGKMSEEIRLRESVLDSIPTKDFKGRASVIVAARFRMMAHLSPLIQQGVVDPAVIEALYREGMLQIDPSVSRMALRDNLTEHFELNPTNLYQAHHDLPLQFELDFLKAGIDPNHFEYGRFVEQIDNHAKWHHPKGFGPGGAFNKMWQDFLSIPANRNRDAILLRLQQIRAGTQFLIKRLDGTVEPFKFNGGKLPFQ